jgi:hypothetical protein
MHGATIKKSYSFPLGKFASVFQTEIYVILLCAHKNITRAYKNKRILIFSDSQVALKTLSGPKVISRLVEECQEALSTLAALNEGILVWVPGHHGIPRNEMADRLARQATAMPLLGPQPALGIPRCLARETIKSWTENQHFSTLTNVPGCRHGRLFIGRPCKKRPDDLLKLGRHQLKMAVAILTGHASERGHLRIMGLFNGDPSCRFCKMETETVQHIICCCEALAHQRYNIFGKPYVEPIDISTASLRAVCLFIRDTGILNLC